MLWRVPAVAGGAGGLLSLGLPYAVVTGSTLGVSVTQGAYTLPALAAFLRDAGQDPTGVYVVGLLVVVGSTLAVAGALTRPAVAVGGGLVQGLAAAAFAYGVLTSGSTSVLVGLGQFEANLATGVSVLAASSLVTAATALVVALEGALDRASPEA